MINLKHKATIFLADLCDKGKMTIENAMDDSRIKDFIPPIYIDLFKKEVSKILGES